MNPDHFEAGNSIRGNTLAFVQTGTAAALTLHALEEWARRARAGLQARALIAAEVIDNLDPGCPGAVSPFLSVPPTTVITT